MTTATRALYMRGDLLVLRQDEKQSCMVTENQMPGATHVKVMRANQIAAELLRNEDVMPIGQRERKPISRAITVLGATMALMLVGVFFTALTLVIGAIK